ncbi:MAG: signal peptidase I [Treponema sp.]|nr:signal peptidase I [Treponema sp.]MCL2236835.1 signal peptidase I [Treponema sp.]
MDYFLADYALAKNNLGRVNMFDKSRQYSYRAQKNQRNKIFVIIFVFFVLYVSYNCLTAFFFSVWVVDNDTMQPGLNKGDRIVFSSFNAPWNGNDEENQTVFKRGNIVLVDMRHYRDKKLPLRIIDGFARFFTAQRISIFRGEGQYYVKRVIGLGGDEVSMNNYGFRVKASGSTYVLTEYELSNRSYLAQIPQVTEQWNESIPFSGNMNAITLGPNECFVASDDRSNTNDSRTWGPISPSLISARAVFRFWPLNRIGLL